MQLLIGIFKINTFRFVTKPFNIEEIEEALQGIRDLYIGMEKIEVYYNRIKYYVCQRDIVFIITYGSFTEICVGNKRFRKDISLSELEKVLDDKLFFRPNRQYMINMFYITKVENDIIQLNKEKIKIYRRKRISLIRNYTREVWDIQDMANINLSRLR